jgi:hypothetical protein
MLGAALLARFVKVGATWKERMFSGPNAPFASFYSKAVAGYAVGLYGPLTYADIDLIRRIRNEFAHRATPLQFGDDPITELCSKLTTPSRIQVSLGTPFPLETGAKVQYCRAVYGVGVALRGQISSVQARPSHPDVLP